MHFHEINLGYFSIEIKWLHSVPIIVIITHYLILSSVCLQPSFMITERPKIIMIINIHCRRGPVHLIHTGVSCGLDFPGRAWSLSRTWPSRWQTEYRQHQKYFSPYSRFNNEHENIMHDPSESKNGVSMTREKQVNFFFLIFYIYIEEILAVLINHFFIMGRGHFRLSGG